MNVDMLSPREGIRLVFEMERADNPRLYDDLIRFKKGAKRVNRLRTLAHEGLLFQHWTSKGDDSLVEVRREGILVDGRAVSITNQVFEEPLLE